MYAWIKHIFQSILLILLLVVIYAFPRLSISPYFVWGCLIGLGIFLTGGYVYLKKKKFPKMILLLFFFLSFPLVVFADDNASSDVKNNIEQLKEKIQQNKDKVCKANSKIKDPLKAKEKHINNEAYAAAFEIEELIRKTKTEGEYKEAYTCATQYIDKVGKIKYRLAGDLCEDFPSYAKRTSNLCWPCALARIFLKTAQKVSTKTTPIFLKISLTALFVGFLFFLAIRIASLFGRMGTANNDAFWQDILIRSFVVGLITCALMVPGGLMWAFDHTLSPIATMTSSLSKSIVTHSGSVEENSLAKAVLSKSARDMCPSCHAEENTQNAGTNAMIFSDKAVNNYVCMVCVTYRSVAPYSWMGEFFSCWAIENGMKLPKVISGLLSWVGVPKSITEMTFVKPLLMLSGYVLKIMSFILALVIGFAVLDALFDMVVFVILLPFFFSALAFPSTRKYFNRGLGLFVHALVYMILIAILVSLIVVVISSMFSADVINRIAAQMGNPDPNGDKLFNAYATPHSLVSSGLFIFVCIFGIRMIKPIEQIAIGFSGNSGGGSGSDALMLGKKVVTGAAKVATVGAGAAAAAVGGFVSARMGKGEQAGHRAVQRAFEKSEKWMGGNKWSQQRQEMRAGKHGRLLQAYGWTAGLAVGGIQNTLQYAGRKLMASLGEGSHFFDKNE